MKTNSLTEDLAAACLVVLTLTGVAEEARCQIPRVTLDRNDLNQALRVQNPGSLRILDPTRGLSELPQGSRIEIPAETLFADRVRGSIETMQMAAGLTFVLPDQLKKLDAETREVVAFDPVVRPDPERLTFDPEGGGFATTLHVGLVRTDSSDEPVEVSPSYQLMLRSDVARVENGTVALNRTGFSSFHEVPVRLLEPRETVTVSIDSGGDRETLRIKLRVDLPRISMQVSPNPIWGFGLATATIAVRAPGARLRGVESLTLGYDRGSMEGSETVLLNSDGAGIARIRSGGLGTATIHAEHSHYFGGSDTVEFVWPVGFLVACLLGGVLGGLIRFWRLPEAARHLGRAVLRGCVTAVLVAVASATGINLLGVDIGEGTSEALVFVVSALGAIMGIQKPGPASPPAPTS